MLFQFWLQDVVKHVFPQLTSDTCEGPRHRIFKALKYFFLPFYFTCFMCRWKTLLSISGLFGSIQLVEDHIDLITLKQATGGQRWRRSMREMGGHQRWPESMVIVWNLAATSLDLSKFGFRDKNDYFRQHCQGPFKCYEKNGLLNLHRISKPLTHTTQHKLSTVWLITDDLGRGGPGLVWSCLRLWCCQIL